MSVFGGMSKGERNRIKARVRSAMAAQAEIEGRILGGRPPYGYMIVDNSGFAATSLGASRVPLYQAVGRRSVEGVTAGRSGVWERSRTRAAGVAIAGGHDVVVLRPVVWRIRSAILLRSASR